MSEPSPLKRAVELAGGQSALAGKLGIWQSVVNGWLRRNKSPPPPEFCAPIESETGVRCEEFYPDYLWHRDASGRVTGYTVPVKQDAPASNEAHRAAA